MNLVEVSTPATAQKEAITKIWNAEYPIVIRHKNVDSFNAYLDKLSQQNHWICYDNQNQVSAWFFTFMRDGELNFAMIVSRAAQGKGLGKELLQKAQREFGQLNGWVVLQNDLLRGDGSVYPSPRSFYEKLGFEIDESKVFETPQMKSVKIRWKSKS